MKRTWNLSGRKWIYWTGVAGFILSFQLYLWLIAVILYFTCDRGMPRTKKYQIEKVYEKYMIVAGNIGLISLMLGTLLLYFKIDIFA